MAKVTIQETTLESIGDAIRAQLEVDTEYKPSQMPTAIRSIEKADLESLSATVNGTYLPTSGHNGFDRAVVNVPNTYESGDEGKVVSNGALVSQTSATKTANGTYDTTLNNEIVVDVPAPTGNINITDTQQTDVSAYATAQVVDADLVAGNIKKDVDILGVIGTYEGSGSGTLVTKTITENGTYDPADDNADGYSEVTVNVSGGGGMQYDSSAALVDPSEYAHGDVISSFTIGFTFESTAEVQ